MASCWDRFDFRAAAMFTGHPHRTESLRRELDRVGLVVQDFWGHPNVFDRFIQMHVRCTKGTAQPGFFNATMTHYHILKTAYELGKRSVLVIENDIRFLKDTALLAEIVESLPQDFDIALFDWEAPHKTWRDATPAQLAAPRINGHWARFGDLRSFACYAMSRRGMAHWLNCVERTATNPMAKFLICDMYCKPGYLDPSLNTYCAIPNAGVQGTVERDGGGEAGISPADLKWQKYSLAGIRREDYAT